MNRFQRGHVMERKTFFSQDTFIFITALIAVISGWIGWSYMPGIISFATIIAEIFMNLLRLISLPIIFLSIVATISSMKSFDEMKVLGKTVLKYTLFTTIIAATVALILYLLINPAKIPVDLIAKAPTQTLGQTYLSFLLKIIPENMVLAFSDNTNVMGVVFIAILLSFSILTLPHEHKSVLQSFFSALFAAILRITNVVIYFMPVGVWAFITIFTAQLLEGYFPTTPVEHFIGLKSLGLYVACILLANVIQGVIVLPLLLSYHGFSPMRIAKGMYSALMLAFFSKSSNATLPMTIKCAEERVGVSKRVAHFTLPLCSIINMNGCAAFILITVLYVSMTHGMTYTMLDMIAWIFIATIAAVGNAGVPMGCYFLASAFLVGMDIPLHLMGVILPIYTVIDMVETALNVWSDSCIAAIVDKEISSP